MLIKLGFLLSYLLQTIASNKFSPRFDALDGNLFSK